VVVFSGTAGGVVRVDGVVNGLVAAAAAAGGLAAETGGEIVAVDSEVGAWPAGTGIAETPGSPDADAEVAGAEVVGADAEVAGADAEVAGADADVAGADAEVAGADAEVAGADGVALAVADGTGPGADAC
jgi:hypothetical protein